VSILSDLILLKALAAKPPKLDNEMKRDWRFRAGYSLGFQHALEDALEICEENDETG
jgi:hypothetical protein